MEDAYHEILTRPLRGTGLSFNGAQRLEHRAAARARSVSRRGSTL